MRMDQDFVDDLNALFDRHGVSAYAVQQWFLLAPPIPARQQALNAVCPERALVDEAFETVRRAGPSLHIPLHMPSPMPPLSVNPNPAPRHFSSAPPPSHSPLHPSPTQSQPAQPSPARPSAPQPSRPRSPSPHNVPSTHGGAPDPVVMFIARYEPVRLVRRRADGWTGAAQRHFLTALAYGASVEKAANAVGMGTRAA